MIPDSHPALLVSVVVPTHNPHIGRLRRTLAALRAQTLEPDRWETILVDNASQPPLAAATLDEPTPQNFRIVPEPTLGLTAARRRGLLEARAPVVVFADDDNVLAADYLAQVTRRFAMHAELGAAGGRSLPEFESQPPTWTKEFFPLLALRDFGPEPSIATSLSPADSHPRRYPGIAPIGAGMAVRQAAVRTWLEQLSPGALTDRRGTDLSSAGDNDMVFSLLEAGWHVGYFPELCLTHLIPAARLEPGYLGRLNRGIQKSWMQVLTRHGANPWPEIPAWTVPLRQFRAWFSHRAWSSRAAQVRWQGACGHFEGRRRRPVVYS